MLLECKYYANVLQQLREKKTKENQNFLATLSMRNFDGIFRVRYFDELRGKNRIYNVCRALCLPEINRMDSLADNGNVHIFPLTFLEATRFKISLKNALC